MYINCGLASASSEINVILKEMSYQSTACHVTNADIPHDVPVV
jgi:hypothetical protein